MIEAVLFDMDGIMFDTEALSIRMLRKAAEKFGCEKILEVVPRMMGSNAKTVRKICVEHMGDDFPYDTFMRYRQGLVDRSIAENGVPVKPGLRELLGYLDREGYRKAVATSTSRAHAMEYLAKADVLDFFDAVICGDMLEKSKPDPEIYQKAAAAVGAAPENCMALEDSPNGVASASAAGARTVMVPDLIPFGPEQEKQVYACVPALADVIPLLAGLRRENG